MVDKETIENHDDATFNLGAIIDPDYHKNPVMFNAFINPDFVFRVDNFFIDYWLPLLGTRRALLVITMQQACWTGNKPGQSTQISQEKIGRQCLSGRQWVNLSLNTDNLLSWFIPKKLHNVERGKVQSNSYDVRYSSPLTPPLAGGLHREISVRLDDEALSLSAIVSKLLDEANEDRKGLLERLRLPETPVSFPLRTVGEIVRSFVGKGEMDEALAEQIGELSTQLLQPEKCLLMPQYYRREWVSLLGHQAAWLVLAVRRTCYKDDGEVRDEFAISKAEMARWLGVSGSTMKRLLKNEYLPDFFRMDDGDVWEPGRYDLVGRAVLEGPLTREDRAALQQMETDQFGMEQPADSDEPAESDTMNGQKATRPTDKRSKSDMGNGQKTTRPTDERSESDTVNGQKATRPTDKRPKSDTGNGQKATRPTDERSKSDTVNGQKATAIQDSLALYESGRSKHYIHTADAPAATTDPPPNIVREFLIQMGITPNTRPFRELLTSPRCADAGYRQAWLAWEAGAERDAAGQRKLGPGFVVSQLRLKALPPPLSDSDLMTFTTSGEEGESDLLLAYITQTYEANLGKITPLMADEIIGAIAPNGENLRDETLWAQSFRQAASGNKRNLAYLLAAVRGKHADQGRETAAMAAAQQKAATIVAQADMAKGEGAAAENAEPVGEAERLWAAVLKMLEGTMTVATFDTWVKNTWGISFDGEALTVQAGNRFAKEWLENRLGKSIHRAATAVAGQPVRVNVVVDEAEIGFEKN